jgi:release factor glutamine methyltransferase
VTVPPDQSAVPELPALVARLRSAGCVFAEDEARLLLDARPDGAGLEALVARRVAGEPLEHLLGWVDVYGLRVEVDPGVFVPRQRSGLLVREALAAVRPGSVVVELCCGAAAIGVAIATHAGCDVELHAADIDPAAVACAARNVAAVGGRVRGRVRGRVHRGDLFEALPAGLRGRVDVLVVNAPYVPTDELGFMPTEARLHEPRVALDGGPDGVDLHRRVAAGAPAWLSQSGRLLVETSDRQADLTVRAVEAAGLAASVVRDDDLGGVAVAGAFPQRHPGP